MRQLSISGLLSVFFVALAPLTPSSMIGVLQASEQTEKRNALTQTASDVLRHQLAAAYTEAVRKGSLGDRNDDVRDAISSSLHPGMPFDEAEDILRAAGFVVSPRPNEATAANINRPYDWYAVLAVYRGYNEFSLGRCDVVISLIPNKPLVYDRIKNIEAYFDALLP